MTPERITSLSAVIPAAGASSRFGQVKQLIPYRGQPLITRCIEAVSTYCANVIVVTGANRQRVSDALPASVQIVNNSRWQQGLASSLAAAVAVVPASCTGILIAMPDQLLVSRTQFGQLVALWQQQPDFVIAARYDDTTGVPAILPRRLFDAVGNLQGDHGARRLIAADAKVLGVDIETAAVDIDTPQDLASLSGQTTQ